MIWGFGDWVLGRGSFSFSKGFKVAETATTDLFSSENPNDFPVAALLQMLAGMTPNELRDRTRPSRIYRPFLFGNPSGRLGRQSLGNSTSESASAVAANYRAACRGRSGREFCAKIGVVAEEADETIFWLELLAIARPTFRRDQHQGSPGRPASSRPFSRRHTNRESKSEAPKQRRERPQGLPNHQITESPKSPNHQEFLSRIRRLVERANGAGGSR